MYSAEKPEAKGLKYIPNNKKHPMVDSATHERLLNYLLTRVQPAYDAVPVTRYSKIDREFAGYVSMSATDRERLRAREEDGEQLATNVNLPVTAMQIDDMLTYFAETFAPNHGMFYVSGSATDNEVSQDMISVMNSHAIEGSYFRHALGAMFNILKYNLGGFRLDWSVKLGYTPQFDGNEVTSAQSVVWSGNAIKMFDMYNTFVDSTVHPTELHSKGEWFAVAEPVSWFNIAESSNNGEIYNTQEFLDTVTPGTKSTCKFYRAASSITNINLNQENQLSDSAETNWAAWIMDANKAGDMAEGELLTVYIKINPVQFNLVNPKDKATRNKFEIWEFVILNGTWIISTKHKDNMHGHLPAYFGVAYDDSNGMIQKSVSEILIPLQSFASFLMNSHIAGTRKNIFGLTLYDPDVVDLSSIAPGEQVNAIHPVKGLKKGSGGIKDSIWRDDHQIDTEQTMDDLGMVMELAEKFFPTMMPSAQVANIDRAIESQVAAVQHGASRRLHKIAKLMDTLLYTPMRVAMYYNILQYMSQNVTVVDHRGKARNIDITKLRETDLPYIIGQGLKALDRNSAAGIVQKLIFAIIQSPIAQRVDVMRMMSAWVNLLDIDLNMAEFALSNEQVQQNATAENPGEINPMTNPQAVTAPLTKTGVNATVNAGISNA